MRMVSAPVRAIVGAAVGVTALWHSWDASGLADRPVVVAVAIAAMAVVAVLLPQLQASLVVPGAVPVLVGVVLFAIYCCVPETDQIPQVASAVAVLIALEVAARRTLAWWAILPVFGWVMWSGLFGATGRESALVGTLFAVWPLVLPGVLSCVLSGRARPAAAVASVAAVAAVASVAAIGVARTGALQPTVRPALVAVLVASAVSVAVSVVVATLVSVRAGRPQHTVR